MVKSIGIIETLGYTAALRAADMMVKMAYVNVVKQDRVGSGIVAIIIEGDIESVKIALEVGAEAARCTGELVAVHSIAKPLFQIHKEDSKAICNEEDTENEESEEEIKAKENTIVENGQATICSGDGEDVNERI